ncbi:MAG: Ppx/GppA family phosphatase [Atopococcus tabaci]|uniref:Ppx/GppA family phosphatase n=1 Tax=Atopococcus tabaci TaxID=269774 RepID=A0AA43UCE9_9LACT|nr:Ppx/GppA family phosphatase [Atopococcus tabaci]
MKNENRVALVDIGSNTVRLVIFSYDQFYNVSELQNIKVPARLASYINEDSEMTREGIDKLTKILINFKRVVMRFDVENTIYVATAAVRQSKNVKAIEKEVKKKLDLDMQVLSEDQEAFYGNYAVRHTMDFKKGVTVDIGGGSTEVVLFTQDRRLETVSLPFGAVTLKEKFFEESSHNNTKAIKKTCKFIRQQLETLDWLVDSEVSIIGIGGSVRNIGEVHQRANDYPIAGIHGYRMSVKDIEETLQIFTSRTMSDLDDLDGLSKERKDTIIPANIVFQQILEVAESENLYISNNGLREGYIIEYLNEKYNTPYGLSNIKAQQIARIARKYKVSSYAVNQRFIIADELVRELEKNKILTLSQKELKIMYYGCVLYYLGAYIENSGWSQHTFYIISNISLAGFNQKERITIALIASFKNKSLFNQYTEDFKSWFTSVELERILYLGGIVKFAEALNDSQVNIVENIQIDPTDSGDYNLTVNYAGSLIAEEYRANKQKNHIQRFIDGDLHITFNDHVK